MSQVDTLETSAQIISNQSDLAFLLCGNTSNASSEIDEILSHISESIDLIVNEIRAYSQLSRAQQVLYGPFLGRSLLELGATAIIARIDPFRVLILRGKQKQTDYEIDKPHKSSIRWQGDVMDKKVDNLWSDKNLENPTRAILGDYITDVVLKGCSQILQDESDEESAGDWYLKFQNYDAQGLLAHIRQRFLALYSSLSKGIHHEMVIPVGAVFDDTTIKTLLNDTLYNVSTLALIVNFVPHLYNKGTNEESFSRYKLVQQLEME
ncbi:hypothetical protein NTJ19_002366 [Yersinia ruckeri]|uniref:hypothetical protein n=1 Tax=Yersinia enterocolitica TaxID=630 RepID=UPI00398D3595|nr:hypothetical protein [Yersinia ruckeri]EKN4205492.1 hypothetical protein [Yersinia ruckeri]EKN4703739.1 hypothetical protein [Yersinia ruckeri]